MERRAAQPQPAQGELTLIAIAGVIQCDIREGWSDEQKRALASGLTKVVAEVGKVPIKSVHIVIREARGLHFMFGGEPVPEFKPAAGG